MFDNSVTLGHHGSMAKWLVFRTDGGLRIEYRNLMSGQSWDCGTVGYSCPLDTVVQWIMQQGPGHNDIVSLPDGKVLHISKTQNHC